MQRAYQIAIICGSVPLLLGVSIFLLWLITRWDLLMGAGILTIYSGVIIVLIGLIALAYFCGLAFRSPELPRRRVWRSVLGCAALLLANFPVAAGITAAAIAIETRYTVTVRNTSPQPLNGVHVSGGGCQEDFGTIPTGGEARRSFYIKHDDSLQFRATSGAVTHAETIDDYVTNSLGGDTIVTINPDGTLAVSSKQS